MIAAFITQFGPYIVGILGVIAGMFGIYVSGKKTGKAEVIEEQSKAKVAETLAEAKATVEQVTETVKGASDVQADINRLSPGVAADQLRNDWNAKDVGTDDKES